MNSKEKLIDGMTLEAYLRSRDKVIVQGLLDQWEWEQENNLDNHLEKIEVAKKVLVQ